MAETKTFYQQLGGDAGVRQLVDRFYDKMDTDQEVQTIRQLHAKSLRGSREKLYLFLSGWLGGPDLYVQTYGHARLRQRHFPFPITTIERDQWMLCMKQALSDAKLDPLFEMQLINNFMGAADHMRNKSEDEAISE